MAFTPAHNPRKYVPSPPQTIEGGERERTQRELMNISIAIEVLINAVAEIQNHLDTL